MQKIRTIAAPMLRCCWHAVGRCRPCSAGGAESDELDGFHAPASSDLDGKHDEAAPRGTQQLWLDLVSCVCYAEDCCDCVAQVSPPMASRIEGRNEPTGLARWR